MLDMVPSGSFGGSRGGESQSRRGKKKQDVTLEDSSSSNFAQSFSDFNLDKTSQCHTSRASNQTKVRELTWLESGEIGNQGYHISSGSCHHSSFASKIFDDIENWEKELYYSK
ncbi:hypothetical protein RIF29_19025 [Crotalaria pallida]|uniref:Uncharacterized protein n=1 Tax=Crotalaria pallida TaxID=3830 RepID=A0AAN9IB15_CROPI